MQVAPSEAIARLQGYDRTILAFHGTSREAAIELVNGSPFRPSDRDMEWMGTGVYFWEHAPRQAWQWARDVRREASPAVVGALRRLGRCFDLLDPLNVATLQSFHTDMAAGLSVQKNAALRNTRRHKKRDCAVFNHLYEVAEAEKQPIDSVRGVFVPAGQTRAWTGSWVHEEAHIQICVRNPKAVIAVWHVRENGSYGLPAVDEQG